MTELSNTATGPSRSGALKKKPTFLNGMSASLFGLRRVPFEGEINERRCNKFIESCAELAELNRELPITILFDSKGGDIDTTDRLLDSVGALGVRLQGVVIGQASSAALDVFLRCDKRKRFALPRARVLVHFAKSKFDLVARSEEQVLKDAEKYARDVWQCEKRGRKWICERTGLTPEDLVELLKIGQDLELTLNTERMVELGFAADVLEDFDFKKPHKNLEPWLREQEAEEVGEEPKSPQIEPTTTLPA